MLNCLKSHGIAILPVLLGICAALPMFQTVQAQRSTRLVQSVQVVGNRRISAKEILAKVNTRSGEPFNQEQIRRDLLEVLKLGQFDKLETRVILESGSRGDVVTFEVVELALVSEVKFNELRGIDETEVLQLFRERDIHLEKDAVYDALKTPVAVHVLQEILASRGWPNARITVRSEVGSSFVSIEFQIRYKD